MNKIHINLYKIIWQSIGIQAVFLLGFLFLNSYIHYKNTTIKVQYDIQSELTKQSDFFASELYLGQNKALEMRLQGIENSLLSLYPDLKLCLKLIPAEESLSKVTVHCRKGTTNFSRSDKIIPIQLGGVLLAEVQYAIALPFRMGQALPLNLLLAIIFSCILVSIVQFFLIQKLKKRVIEPLFETIKSNARSLAIAETASQVAHDIRSPLTALDITVKSIMHLPEDQRELIRNAVNRIHDIANNLLTTYTQSIDKEQEHSEIITAPELMADMLLSVLSEKRTQYKDLPIEFITEFGKDAYSLFSNVPSIEFKRVLSNLINNAVESIHMNGSVELRLNKNKDSLLLEILDTGCGMSSELLSKVMAGGVSVGKKGGAGLGLFSAIKLVESWGGKFSISSIPNKGTIITIRLAQASRPPWFSESLLIREGSTVVVVDDDASIHNVWKKRFEMTSSASITLLNFCNPDELIQWYQKTQPKEVLFLIDYEFIGHALNGLTVIEQLEIVHCARLVTSRYENKAIQHQCEQLGLTMIPKSFAVHIPIKIFCMNPDIIFIDDHQSLTDAWKFRGEIVGRRVETFNSLSDFKMLQHYYALDIPIYIDSDLGAEISGEMFAKTLYEQGYKTLYLVTGHDKAYFNPMYWIKEIVGKEPSF